VIDYAPEIKAARLAVVRDALIGGRLALYESGELLASVPLGAGAVEGDKLEFATSEGIAISRGRPDAAQLLNVDGLPVVDGLTVGIDVELDADAVEVGQTVHVVSAVIRHA
jgi:hypothetical protein